MKIFVCMSLVFSLYRVGFSQHAEKKDKEALSFEKIDCGLYRNFYNDIGFLTFDSTDKSFCKKRSKRFITYVYGVDTTNTVDGGLVKLKDVVDLTSFHILSKYYSIDKTYVYVYDEMIDGGTLSINRCIDINSFKVLGEGYYAVDKFHVYFKGVLMEKADVNSFNVFAKDKNSQYGYDENYFYDGTEILSDNEIKLLGFDKQPR